jgi:peptidoglycan/LPS O-acetylase OafA/YrhL
LNPRLLIGHAAATRAQQCCRRSQNIQQVHYAHMRVISKPPGQTRQAARNVGPVIVLVLMFATTFFAQHYLFSGSVLFCFLAMTDSPQTALGRLVGFGKRTLSGPTSQFFGAISYAVYLTHQLILIPLFILLEQFVAYQSTPPVVRFAILFGATATVVIPFAFAPHRRIELPGIEFGRRLAKRVTHAGATPYEKLARRV